MKPAIRPSVNPRRVVTPGSAPLRPFHPLIATSSGTSATNATAGCPYFGNDSASSDPESAAAAAGAEMIFSAIYAFRGLAHDPGLELLFFLQLRRHGVSLAAFFELADAHTVWGRRSLGRGHDVGRISLRDKALHHAVGVAPVTQRANLDLEAGSGGLSGRRRGRWRGRFRFGRPRRWRLCHSLQPLGGRFG